MGNKTSAQVIRHPPPPPSAPLHATDVTQHTYDPNTVAYNLYKDGFVHISDIVSKALVDNALRAINCSIGKHAPVRENPCPDCANSSAILDLFHKSGLSGIVKSLVSPHHQAVGGGQVALRYPGDGSDASFNVPPNWHKHWHIDGLATPSGVSRIPYGDVHNFTALVGVVLQDAEEDFMGNLTVYPGSHFEMQDYFQRVGAEDLMTRGTDALPTLPFARGHKQIHARAGDVVIANYCTAHNIAPNVSPFIRYAVYFRVSSLEHRSHVENGKRVRVESLVDVWRDWPGLRRTLEKLEADDSQPLDV